MFDHSLIFRRIVLAPLLLVVACATPAAELPFDLSHVQLALRYFETGNDNVLTDVANTPAALHLMRHAENSGYFPPTDTARDITAKLLGNKSTPALGMQARVRALVQYAAERAELQNSCLKSAAANLPAQTYAPPRIFATWGYDIGVATDLGVSLNFAHEHFLQQPEEIWFYCIHEAHHHGVIRLHAFPHVQDTHTVGELIALVRYLTFLEGTAVAAAYDARMEAKALDADPDYVAIRDETHMESISRRFTELMGGLKARDPTETLNDSDWNIVDEMSSGERLWYRHGARMALTTRSELGLSRYLAVIEAGPDAFFRAYEKTTHGQVKRLN